jgi:hypothetical protein
MYCMVQCFEKFPCCVEQMLLLQHKMVEIDQQCVCVHVVGSNNSAVPNIFFKSKQLQ